MNERTVYTVFANRRPIYHGVDRDHVKEVCLARLLDGESLTIETIKKKSEQ